MALILLRLLKVIITKLVNVLKNLIKLIKNKNMIRQHFTKWAINLVFNMTKQYKICIVSDWMLIIFRGT